MAEFLNIVIGGLVTGAIYGLVALGFSLVFNVTGVLNLAQGAFVVTGALLFYTFRASAHLPLLVAFVCAALAVTIAIGIIEWVLLRKAVTEMSHTGLLMLMGGLLTSAQGIGFLVWGSNPFTLPGFTGSKSFSIGGVFIAPQDIWVIGVAVVLVVAVWAFLTKTRTGTALRASAENRQAARLMGIGVDRTVLLSFVASGLLGVAAGAVILPLTSLDYGAMSNYTNLGLIAVTVGGLGSIFGAAAGGLVFGLLEALITGYVSSLFATAISLILLVAILLWRPRGLLSKVRGSRVDLAEVRSGLVVLPVRLTRRTKMIGLAVVGVVMLVLPNLGGLATYMRAINITGVFCLTIVGLELVTGIAGQVSLGQAGFMAVGGYTSGILIVQDHVTPFLAMLAGVAASLVVALVLGMAGARVRGMYLAIVTLSFGILIESIARDLSITGGPSGLAGIPSFSVGGYSFGTDTRFYYLVWGLVAVSLLVTSNLLRSNRGRALRAMHGDDIGSRSLGVNLARTKTTVFAISSVMASVAGTLYACYFHYLSPTMVGSAASLSLITMLVVGGIGTQAGPLVGVALLTFFPQVSQSLQRYEPVIDGALLVLFLRYLPGGIYGGLVDGARAALSRLRRIPEPAFQAERQIEFLPVALADLADGAAAEGSDPAVPTSPDPSLGGSGKGPAFSRAGRSGPVLAVNAVSKTFGGLRAVSGVSLTLEEGAIGALIGPNGAGKSTLFNLVTNLYRPDEGSVELEGEDVTGLSPDVIARKGLFRTFQTSRVFSGLSVVENVLVGGYRLSQAGYAAQSLWARRARTEEKDLVRRAMNILEVVGLADLADEPGHVLPLAAQKYLDVGRALMSGSRVLLFDEPGAGMNDTETMELGALLLAVRDAGHSILVVDHNMALVMGIADMVTVMDVGSVIAQGPPASVQADSAVVDAYFGRAEVAS